MGNFFSKTTKHKKYRDDNYILLENTDTHLNTDSHHILNCRINEIESSVEKINDDLKNIQTCIKTILQNITQIKVDNANDIYKINTNMNNICIDLAKLLDNDKHLKSDIIQIRADLRNTKDINTTQYGNLLESNM